MFGKSFKIAIGALVAGIALTACGPVKTGAAAIVGGDRIGIGTLDAAVQDWSTELPKYPDVQRYLQQQKDQDQQGVRQSRQAPPFDPSSDQRSALYQLVDLRVWNEVARENGISAGPGDVDAFVSSHGGAQNFDRAVLANVLPTRYDRDYAKAQVVQEALLNRYGIVAGQPADPQKQRQAVAAYVHAGKALHITVNPRYGSFDYNTMALGAVCPRLSTPDSGTPDGPDGQVKCLD